MPARFFRALVLVAVLCASQAAVSQLTKQDTLECTLANGDRFDLKARYLYLALPRLPHGNNRVNQEPFAVYFVPRDGKQQREPVDRADHINLNDETLRRKACAQFNSFGGLIGTVRGYIFPGETAVRSLETQGELSKPIYKPAQLDQQDRDALAARGFTGFLAAPVYVAAGFVAGQVQLEAALARPDGSCDSAYKHTCPIQGVWKFHIRHDKTLSIPTLTEQSDFFVMGVPLFEQPGLAKPTHFKVGPGL